MRLQVADDVEAFLQLVDQGCGGEFYIKDGRLFDLSPDAVLDPKEIHVDTALRLESGRRGEDGCNIYANKDRKSYSKALLIEALNFLTKFATEDWRIGW